MNPESMRSHDPTTSPTPAGTGSGARPAATAGTARGEPRKGIEATSQEARELGRAATGRLRERGRAAVVEQRDRLVTVLTHVSEAVHAAGKKLHDDGEAGLGDTVETVAEQCDAACEHLARQTPADLVDELRCAARTRPALFLGGMFLAGLGLARFAKASQTKSYRTNEPVPPAPARERPAPGVTTPAPGTSGWHGTSIP